MIGIIKALQNVLLLGAVSTTPRKQKGTATLLLVVTTYQVHLSNYHGLRKNAQLNMTKIGWLVERYTCIFEFDFLLTSVYVKVVGQNNMLV